mmetsp:Transcript_12105/g.38325  ORF Transcript_12105/g.38325 Transcript_12105/m.38325 type:complete len:192 (+) Transcript_12105:1838-2413(+)
MASGSTLRGSRPRSTPTSSRASGSPSSSLRRPCARRRSGGGARWREGATCGTGRLERPRHSPASPVRPRAMCNGVPRAPPMAYMRGVALSLTALATPSPLFVEEDLMEFYKTRITAKGGFRRMLCVQVQTRAEGGPASPPLGPSGTDIEGVAVIGGGEEDIAALKGGARRFGAIIKGTPPEAAGATAPSKL